MTAQPKRITDIGPPHYEKFLPPIIKKNYGLWKYHEKIAPGYTATSQRQATGSIPFVPLPAPAQHSDYSHVRGLGG